MVISTMGIHYADGPPQQIRLRWRTGADTGHDPDFLNERAYSCFVMRRHATSQRVRRALLAPLLNYLKNFIQRRHLYRTALVRANAP